MEDAATAPPSCICVQASSDALLTHGPVLGAATDSSIKIWVRADRSARVAIELWREDEPEAKRCSAPVAVSTALDHTASIALADLEPATRYGYRVLIGEAADDCLVAMEGGTFRTLPTAGEPARFRFAVGADVRGSDVPGFADVAAIEPDFMLMIGDNVYADDDGFVDGDFEASFGLGQQLYQRVWGGHQFRELFAQVPVFMMWDDHEIMENYWSGKDDLRYGVGRLLFDAYQGSHNPDPLNAGELYYSFEVGDVSFFVLDARTHRDGNMDADDADKSMLGARQRQAFEQWLADDDSRVHVIVSSVIVGNFTTTGHDPWKSFSVERDALLDVIVEHGTENTFVVSGDQHWSAVLKLVHGELAPYTLYEFQTTPLGSGLRAAPERPNDTVLALDNTHQVFGVFDIDTRVDPPLLDFTLCAVGKPCMPHTEPAPQSIDSTTAVIPYSAFFEGTDRGFSLLTFE